MTKETHIPIESSHLTGNMNDTSLSNESNASSTNSTGTEKNRLFSNGGTYTKSTFSNNCNFNKKNDKNYGRQDINVQKNENSWK